MINYIWQKICTACNWFANTCIGKFLAKTEVPIWLLAATWIVAAYSTYKISPNLNAQFEQNRMIAQATLDQVKSINSGNKLLLQSLSSLMSEVQLSEKPSDKTKANINSQIIALQWQSIELKAIDSTDQGEVIAKYQKSLTSLSRAVAQLENSSGIEALESATEHYVSRSAVLTSSRLGR